MSSDKPLYSQPGVLIDPEGSPKVVGIRWATLSGDDKTVKVKWASGKTEEFPVSQVTQDPRTDTLVFVSNGVRYTIRDLRSQDGQWLSSIGVEAPVAVLETLILRGDQQMSESLTAYAIGDSAYIIGLVYNGPTGSWVRMNGDWAHQAPGDETFQADNIEGIDIDPAKAQQYIDLYDKNYVTVTDTEQYESADAEPEVAPAQSDE